MKQIDALVDRLSKVDGKILFLTTSNRWSGQKELPKSSILAAEAAGRLKDVQIIDVSKLKIFPCEGNVSGHAENNCGIKAALLKDKSKNPHGEIRCWASINNPTDEMHKVANAIIESGAVVFFGSIRWGKMNAIYTQIVERLTWIENRHTSLREKNILKGKLAGVVAVGHNWNGKEAVKLEKEVLEFFGFDVPEELSFSWQYLDDAKDETLSGYKKEYGAFKKAMATYLESAVIKFKEFLK
jgi:multimeric flavodoxin WrbA